MSKPKDPQAHPAASVWPMLPEPDLRRLAADIATNGLRHPIVLDREGLILDGRNRYAACCIAGVEPAFETFDGEDPVSYILSANNERRHLSLPQRAAATALTLAEAGRRVGGRWQRGSVPESPDNTKSRNTWQDAMRLAGLVLDHTPDLLPEVASGEMALDAAVKEAQAVKQEKDQREGLPDDLGALVDAGEITMSVALRRAALPDDYQERVASGAISLQEAEHLSTQEQQEHKASVKRKVDNLRTWVMVHPQAVVFHNNEDHLRNEVLDAMEEWDRDTLLKLEKETWPKKR